MHPWLNWIEHLTTDQEVAGSNPAGCTKYLLEIECIIININVHIVQIYLIIRV